MFRNECEWLECEILNQRLNDEDCDCDECIKHAAHVRINR